MTFFNLNLKTHSICSSSQKQWTRFFFHLYLLGENNSQTLWWLVHSEFKQGNARRILFNFLLHIFWELTVWNYRFLLFFPSLSRPDLKFYLIRLTSPFSWMGFQIFFPSFLFAKYWSPSNLSLVLYWNGLFLIFGPNFICDEYLQPIVCLLGRWQKALIMGNKMQTKWREGKRWVKDVSNKEGDLESGRE